MKTFFKIQNIVLVVFIACGNVLSQAIEVQAQSSVNSSNSSIQNSLLPKLFANRQPRLAANQQIQFVRPKLPVGTAPGGRRTGGGRRDSCPNVNPKLTALVPVTEEPAKVQNVWSLTTSERPTLWFYVPYTKNSAYPTEFIVQDQEGNSIHRGDITLPDKPGVMKIDFPDSIPPLTVGNSYRWFLNVYCDKQKEAPPVYVEGVVSRVNLSAKAIQQLRNATPQQQAAIYAENGIWHQTLATLLNMHQKNPQSPTAQTAWKNLLSEVGLVEIADKAIISN